MSTAACRGVASSCAGELDTGCPRFASFLASIFHRGAEIAIAVLEQIQQQPRPLALGSPESQL